MFDFITSLIGGIVDFVLDIVLLRKVREARKRERSWQEDAADVAYVDWWLVLVSFTIALTCASAMYYGLGLPFWISFGIPTVVAGVYCGYKYLELLRR